MGGEHKKKRGTLLWSIALAIITSPVCLVFYYFGEPGKGRAAWFFLIVLVISAKVRWELRKHSWFWVTIAAIAIVESLMVMYVPWTSKWIPAFVLIPFALVDCLVVLRIIQTVEGRMAPMDN